MIYIVLVGLVLLVLFGFVVLFGPPYVPTFKQQSEAALDLLDMKPGETLLELGSGDGRVMLAAARRGIRAVGIELNPLLVLVSYIVTWRYRKQVRIIWGNCFTMVWPRADAVFTFMLPRLMKKVDQKIERWRTKPLSLASFAFRIPDKEPADEKSGVFLYKYK